MRHVTDNIVLWTIYAATATLLVVTIISAGLSTYDGARDLIAPFYRGGVIGVLVISQVIYTAMAYFTRGTRRIGVTPGALVLGIATAAIVRMCIALDSSAISRANADIAHGYFGPSLLMSLIAPVVQFTMTAMIFQATGSTRVLDMHRRADGSAGDHPG